MAQKPGHSDSFADSIRRASDFPDDIGQGGANVTLPSLFPPFPIPEGERIVNDEPLPHAPRIQGVPQYNFHCFLERFIMGQQICGGSKERGFDYEDRDDALKYQALMDRILDGEAILRWEDRKTLNDGTLVIVVSYLVPKTKAKTLEA